MSQLVKRAELAAVLNDQPRDVIASLTDAAARNGLHAELDQLV